MFTILAIWMKWMKEIHNNPERISKLKRFEKDFDWSSIGFPVSIKDIKKSSPGTSLQ